jgi:hypothetical protein
VNVMAPKMQVACKAFIAPNSAARSPKERYAHIPVVQGESVFVDKIGMASHLQELLPKCDILMAARDCQGSWPRQHAHDARTHG